MSCQPSRPGNSRISPGFIAQRNLASTGTTAWTMENGISIRVL